MNNNNENPNAIDQDAQEMESIFLHASEAIRPDPALLQSVLNHVTVPSRSTETLHSNAAAETSILSVLFAWKIALPAIAVIVLVVSATIEMSPGQHKVEQLAINTTEPNIPGDAQTPAPSLMSVAPMDVGIDAAVSSQTMMMGKMMAIAPKTGSVNEIVGTLLAEADGDKGVFAGVSDDTQLVVAATGTTELLNIYDETSF